MSAAWRNLIVQKRRRAVYRITLVVRGREVVKEYAHEDEYRKWKETYEEQRRHEGSGIEQVKAVLVYRCTGEGG